MRRPQARPGDPPAPVLRTGESRLHRVSPLLHQRPLWSTDRSLLPGSAAPDPLRAAPPNGPRDPVGGQSRWSRPPPASQGSADRTPCPWYEGTTRDFADTRRGAEEWRPALWREP